MLTLSLHAPTALRRGSGTGIAPHLCDSSKAVYIITEDVELRSYLSAASEGNGIHVMWFRSASDYLAYKRPDIASCLLISPQLSDMCGLDLRRLLALTFGPPIIFLSYNRNHPSCVRAIREEAEDCLAVPLPTSDLQSAMEAAFRKDHASLLLRRETENLRNRWRSLTSREAEVMRYLVTGFLNKQIAGELNITENTVQVHRGRIMRKMGADSFAMLVRMSLRLGECGEQSVLHTATAS